MITENLSTLKIHKLTQEQYDRELQAGRIDPNALYLTPDTDTSNIYIQNEEPVNVEDGVLWVDMDANGTGGSGGIGGASVFVQDEEPTGANTGTLWLDTDEESNSGGTSGGGGSYEIPTFNLTEMGLPAIPMDGSMSVRSDADFTELKEALSNGIVNLRYAVTISGYTFYGVTKACATYNEIFDCYQVFTSQMLEVGDSVSLFGLGINVFSAYVIGYCREIQYALPDVEEATF